jgi:poly(3-hydroxyoctanoate) depolymerase
VRRARRWAGADQLVRVDGRSIRIRVEGSGDPLLLLNGLTRPLESWGPFLRVLEGRTRILFDLPGVGRSRTPLWPLSMRHLARLAGLVVGEVGYESVDVLGFSYGGAVAQQLAFDQPARVRRLVLAATSCGVGATPGTQEVLLEAGPRWAPASWPRPDPVGIVWHSLAISRWSSIPILAAISAPTLVVCGAGDRVAPPLNSMSLAARIPDARLVILPAGHDLQKEAAARTLAGTVEPFLSGSVRPMVSSGC